MGACPVLGEPRLYIEVLRIVGDEQVAFALGGTDGLQDVIEVRAGQLHRFVEDGRIHRKHVHEHRNLLQRRNQDVQQDVRIKEEAGIHFDRIYRRRSSDSPSSFSTAFFAMPIRLRILGSVMPAGIDACLRSASDSSRASMYDFREMPYFRACCVSMDIHMDSGNFSDSLGEKQVFLYYCQIVYGN